jgi:PPM family protein phosphatase
MPNQRSDDTAEHWLRDDTPAQAAKARQLPVQVEFGALSHIGKIREKNQDHFLVTRIGRSLNVIATNLPAIDLPQLDEDFGYGMVVADGMGGMAAGERASILAIQTGMKLVFESPRWALKIDENEMQQLINRMKEYFQKVDETLIRETYSDPRLMGMGTTLTVAYSVGTNLFIVHAGDSRAYLFRDGQLRQLTRDHALPGAPNVLTNFAGGPYLGITPEIATASLLDGDRLLLCSDGLSKMVSDAEVAEILEDLIPPQPAAQALVDRALEHGGRDNVTVVLAHYTILS